MRDPRAAGNPDAGRPLLPSSTVGDAGRAEVTPAFMVSSIFLLWLFAFIGYLILGFGSAQQEKARITA